jgi:hypothetical protein
MRHFAVTLLAADKRFDDAFRVNCCDHEVNGSQSDSRVSLWRTAGINKRDAGRALGLISISGDLRTIRDAVWRIKDHRFAFGKAIQDLSE